MCGRMLVLAYGEVLDVVRSIAAGPENPYPDWPAQHPRDAFPQDDVPVALAGLSVGAGGVPELDVRMLKWGYPVQWQAGPVFNTRVESILAGKGMWRASFEGGRCLVPTRGFFERHATEQARSPKTGRKVKRQYTFELVDEPITWLAGVSQDGHFSVVTTQPNRFVAPVHDRMPLVLRRSELPLWLEGDVVRLADRSDVELRVAPEASPEPEQPTLF